MARKQFQIRYHFLYIIPSSRVPQEPITAQLDCETRRWLAHLAHHEVSSLAMVVYIHCDWCVRKMIFRAYLFMAFWGVKILTHLDHISTPSSPPANCQILLWDMWERDGSLGASQASWSAFVRAFRASGLREKKRKEEASPSGKCLGRLDRITDYIGCCSLMLLQIIFHSRDFKWRCGFTRERMGRQRIGRRFGDEYYSLTFKIEGKIRIKGIIRRAKNLA